MEQAGPEEHSVAETLTKIVVKGVEKPKAITEVVDKEDKRKSVTAVAMRDMEEVETTHMEAVEDTVPMMRI